MFIKDWLILKSMATLDDWKKAGKIAGEVLLYGKSLVKKGVLLKDVAEKIFHGLSDNIRESRVTGPSSKFPNQKVGLNHILKDKDIIEFHQIR